MIRLLIISIIAAWSLLLIPIPAAASGCPNVEVVFARGTGEPPGVGGVGDDFVRALQTRLGTIGVYAADYPASMDFGGSAIAGVTDIGHHIQSMATTCSGTHMVLGGFSQGAAVAGFVTSPVVPPGVDVGDLQPMNPWIASHVAAVVLFGTPSDNFLGMIGQPPLLIGPLYAGKTMQLCATDDPVCSGGGDWAAHDSYSTNGMVEQAAAYAANHL